MARCGCGGACGCALASGTGTTVTGAGTPANPWTVNADFADCFDVRSCITANQGAVYDQATGNIQVCISGDAGNALTRDVNGCLYMGAGNNSVTAGCGLNGTGLAANPLTIRGKAWPFACDQDSATATGVYCDPVTGEAHGDPPSKQSYFNNAKNDTLATPITVPAALTTIDTFSITVTNPDPCRPALGLLFREIDLQMNMPAGSSGAGFIDGDEMFHFENTGSTTQGGVHAQENKINEVNLDPGETRTITMQIQSGRGSGGANIIRIQATLRVFLWTLEVV